MRSSLYDEISPPNHPLQDEIILALNNALEAIGTWVHGGYTFEGHEDDCDCEWCTDLYHAEWTISGLESILSSELLSLRRDIERSRKANKDRLQAIAKLPRPKHSPEVLEEIRQARAACFAKDDKPETAEQFSMTLKLWPPSVKFKLCK